MERISKSDFKTNTLKILRAIEQSGQPIVITDHGKPTLEIRKLRQQTADPLDVLKGTVIKFDDAIAAVASNDWENA